MPSISSFHQETGQRSEPGTAKFSVFIPNAIHNYTIY